MQIEYWLLIVAFLVLVATIIFLRLCCIQDKKNINAEVNKNKTVFFVEHNSLQWEDLDFSNEQHPTIILPQIGN